jgi:proliferating cell nuclear antigen
MKVVLAEPRFLKDSINVISDLVSDVQIKFDKDKLEIIAMDPANVAMVIFRLLSSSFVEYDVDGEEIIAVNLDNLKQILGRVKPGDSVVLELDNEKNRLRIDLRGGSERKFSLSLIDIREKEQKIPELKFPVSIEMNPSVFSDVVEDMAIVADSVILKAMKDEFAIEANSHVSDANINIKSGDDIKINFGAGDEEKIKSKYSVEYLKKIIKGSKLGNKVVLRFGKDYPLEVNYNVTDRLQLTTILAPRVSND